jgi:3-dehydroquinate dehydratase
MACKLGGSLRSVCADCDIAADIKDAERQTLDAAEYAIDVLENNPESVRNAESLLRNCDLKRARTQLRQEREKRGV